MHAKPIHSKKDPFFGNRLKKVSQGEEWVLDRNKLGNPDGFRDRLGNLFGRFPRKRIFVDCILLSS